jgi:hypothetical protein
MSKGIGGLQRALLAAIQEHGSLSAFEAATHAYKIEPYDTIDGERYYRISDAQDASTRRALAGLAQRGLVDNLGRGFRFRNLDGHWVGRALWCTPRYAEEYRAMHHPHCRHHNSDPPPDPTHALSFWE